VQAFTSSAAQKSAANPASGRLTEPQDEQLQEAELAPGNLKAAKTYIDLGTGIALSTTRCSNS
jgi:hypothetical protein